MTMTDSNASATTGASASANHNGSSNNNNDDIVNSSQEDASVHTAASTNPWDVSPAVTMAQSGLSTNDSCTESYSFQAVPSAEAAPVTATATTTTTTGTAGPAQQESASQQQEEPATISTPQVDKDDDDGAQEGRALTPTTPKNNDQVNDNDNGSASTCNKEPNQPPQIPQSSAGRSNVPTIDTSFVLANYQENDTAQQQPQQQQQQQQQEEEEITGGRLWQAAMQEAERNHSRSTKSTERSRFAESLMERTRSRADPNALISPMSVATNNTSNHPFQQLRGKSSMVTLCENDGSFILSTALAKKRVRVVQLLLIGLLGLLFGLLGNFFVSTSCHFATVEITVGQNQKEFQFHFGLWKYSPIDSVFQGYSYCYKYDQNYSNDSPIVARIANIVALMAGTLAISVLWVYLIFGNADKRRWKWAVRMAVFAGLVQLSTLYFFVGKLCQEYTCSLGPAAYLSILTTVVWIVLACEMHYHTPLGAYASNLVGPSSALEEPRSLVTTMEMAHLDDVTREYLTRVTGKTKEDEMPSLNTDLKRVRPKSGLYSPTSSRAGSNLYQPSPRGTYQAPTELNSQIIEEA